MSTRIRYIIENNNLRSKETFVGKGNTYSILIDTSALIYTVQYTNNPSLTAMGSGKDLNDVKKKAKWVLETLGVEFKQELRNTN